VQSPNEKMSEFSFNYGDLGSLPMLNGFNDHFIIFYVNLKKGNNIQIILWCKNFYIRYLKQPEFLQIQLKVISLAFGMSNDLSQLQSWFLWVGKTFEVLIQIQSFDLVIIRLKTLEIESVDWQVYQIVLPII
jgi:hypothetical protein